MKTSLATTNGSAKWSTPVATVAGLRVYGHNAGDFIDAFLDELNEDSPGSSCYDEDTIRSVLTRMLESED